MIISVAQYKGGVGKTTTAFHVAAYLNQRAPTLLIDNDPNRNAINWAGRGGENVRFKVAPFNQGLKLASQFTHIVNDTKAREDTADLAEIAEGCDLLILPAAPGAMEYETLMDMVAALRQRQIPASQYRVLITMVPPAPARDGEFLYQALRADDVPVFDTKIRQFKAYRKAAQLGVPVFDVKDPRASDAWSDYVNACQEVANA